MSAAGTPAGGSEPIDSGRSSVLVGAGIGLSRLSGLIRESAVGAYLATGASADAFRAALRIPNLLQNLLGEGVLSAAFIPVYARLVGDGDDAEAGTGPVFASAADGRVTRVGRFLRRSRLDELPQLWNILSGDMSLVGPRPERPEFQERISERVPYFSLRSTVKPGLTGWAQIRQGYTAEMDEFEEKFSLDLFYLKHRSVSLDFFSMLRTLRTVVLLEGI